MKEFKTDKGILMVEGKLFNWRKESLFYNKEAPIGFMMDFGDYSATYQPKEKELVIYFNDAYIDFIARFFCENIYIAEIIVNAFIKGNHIGFQNTIYNKISFINIKK